MSVHRRKLPSGKAAVEVRWREGDRNRSRTFDVAKDARDFDKELRRLRQAGEFDLEMNRRQVTVADLIDAWWERSAPRMSPKAVETYAVQITKRVRPTFETRRVAQITVADVERWITGMRKKGDKDPTILKATTVLQALLTIAVRDGIVSVNMAQQARKPAQGRTRTPYLVKPASVEAMRLQMTRAGSERDVMLLELLAYAGLRPESEAITLKWGHVRDRSLLIRDTKRHRERTVLLVEPLAESITQWRKLCGNPDPDTLVVPTGPGGAWSEADWRNWRRRQFRTATLAAGLPKDVRPRDLRGSFVSLLLHEGRSIVEVARQVGHSPAICLRDYAQLFDEVDPNERKPAVEIITAARDAAPDALQAVAAAAQEAEKS